MAPVGLLPITVTGRGEATEREGERGEGEGRAERGEFKGKEEKRERKWESDSETGPSKWIRW